jgi:hypothetical protein
LMYCFICYTLVCISGCHYSDALMLDNFQDLQEQDFEQFEQQGK